jgi:hypothetical protein
MQISSSCSCTLHCTQLPYFRFVSLILTCYKSPNNLVGKTVAALEDQLASLIASKNYTGCEAVELELGVAKALHQKLILEEPRPIVLSVTAPVSQQQIARPGKALVPGDLEPVTPVASREAASQKSKKMTAKKVTGSERPVSKLRPCSGRGYGQQTS